MTTETAREAARRDDGQFGAQHHSEPETGLFDELTDFMQHPTEPGPLVKGQPVIFHQADGEKVAAEVVLLDETTSSVWLRERDGAGKTWVSETRYVEPDGTAVHWNADSARADAAAKVRTDAALAAAGALTSDQIAELGRAYRKLNAEIYLGDSGDGSVPADGYNRAVSAIDEAISHADGADRFIDAFETLSLNPESAFVQLRRSSDAATRDAGWLVTNAVEAELLKDLAFDETFDDFTRAHYELLTSDFKRVTGLDA